MTRVVFLDVDGTLIDHTQHASASTKRACRAAVDNGHVLVLSTGRSMPEIYPELWDLGCTGIVSANGAYVRVGEDVLVDLPIVGQDIVDVSQLLTQAHAAFVWQGVDGLFVPPYYKDSLDAMLGGGGGVWSTYLDYVDQFIHVDTPARSSKCTFGIPYNGPLGFSDIEEHCAGRFTVVAGSVSTDRGFTGEITALGVNKGEGMRVVADHLGVPMADTVAVGDSANDREMLEVAGVGIAMGNGTPQVKAVADWVTAPINEDGLEKAFEYAGLI
ncbi:MAG: HAD family hydrolase [Actinomycetaceae bacterium]|nr:HAD family hydrolase [Actinomycetaceae bacterium]MDU0969908.1 HAD family hydrolase [Actinomycetaceae bacterium]